MTIKELADFAGKDERTIRRWIQKASDKMSSLVQKTKEAHRTKCPMFLDIYEVEEILNSGSMSKDAVSILMQNAKNQNTKQIVDYEMIGKMIGMAVSAAMQPVVQQLQNISNPVLMLDQPEQDHFTLMAYCSLHKIKVNLSEAKKMGMDVKKMTIEAGKEINTIPDERWGKVNSYPVEILEEYFNA